MNRQVTIRQPDNKLQLNEVKNEGFIPPESMGDLAKDGKLGLAGMHERARLIGGKMVVFSEPGQGTRIVVEIENQ